MSEKKYIAADFGAGSGRILIGYLQDEKLKLKEIHRFDNNPIEKEGHVFWDFEKLCDELSSGIEKSLSFGNNIRSIGIDTWGVDFSLLDEKDELVTLPYCYRDSRTDGIMGKVFKIINKERLFNLTGIQLMQINTIFQLYWMKLNTPDLLKKSKTILMMPDLFNFYLTGKKSTEYTIASTSQLLDPFTKKWNKEIFDQLNISLDKMASIVYPGREIGNYKDPKNDNSDIQVIAVGSHDTASAVAAVPASGNDWAFISSGTWSLLGTELEEPIVNNETLDAGFTNEGGANGKIRFLKNVTGMWLIEECLKEWELPKTDSSYDKLIEQAKQATPFTSIIDPDDPLFLHPESMLNAIQKFCKTSDQHQPQSKGEYVRMILESLALKYRHLINSLEQITKKKINRIHVVGGGCQNDLLNQFTANATGVAVLAGPIEATSLGNILVQMIAEGSLQGIGEGRELVKTSFPIKIYQPEETSQWENVYQKKRYLY